MTSSLLQNVGVLENDNILLDSILEADVIYIFNQARNVFSSIDTSKHGSAVISRFDKYVEIWIEHKRKTCIDGYYKKSFMETVMASTVKLGYVWFLHWYMVKSYCTLPDNFLSQCRISRISYTIILYKVDWQRLHLMQKVDVTWAVVVKGNFENLKKLWLP